MTDMKLRHFSGPDGEYGLAYNPEKLPQQGLAKVREKRERKFSIRLRKEDIFLLDILAKRRKTPRSTLINEIIHEIVREELMSIQDFDARVLIARLADQDADYDPMSQPWMQDVLAPNIASIADRVIDFNSTHEGADPRKDSWFDQEMGKAQTEEEQLAVMGHSDLFIELWKQRPDHLK